jgi:hypothetical protein
MSNMHDESHTNSSDDRLASSLPTRIGSYRSLSAKRPRKSVSFNDVPIVHEVPSYDTMRSSNGDIYRSWTYTDATTPISVMSPFSSSQIFSPFNSTSAAAQKINANRLSSVLYSSTNNSTLNRLSDWSTRAKLNKSTEDTIEQSTNWTSPLIIVHTPDDRTNKNSSENIEEKKISYRSAVMPDSEHYRSLPFTYAPLSESTTTYTSMLSTNIIPPNHTSNDQPSTGRASRARSATIPITVNHSSTRFNDNFSITPLRPTTTVMSSNGSSPRTILKPSTVALQSSQSTANNSFTSPPTKPLRISSSRLVSSSNRPLSSSIKYTIAPSTNDSISKPAPTAFPRARSAHVLSSRRHIASPVITLDGQSRGNHNTNLYSTTKRNPNVRQTYGSYYMHRVLLPADIN